MLTSMTLAGVGDQLVQRNFSPPDHQCESADVCTNGRRRQRGADIGVASANVGGDYARTGESTLCECITPAFTCVVTMQQ